MAKLFLEMEVSDDDLEDAVGSLKALAAATQRIDDLCGDMAFLTKAITVSSKEVKELHASVQKILGRIGDGSDT